MARKEIDVDWKLAGKAFKAQAKCLAKEATGRDSSRERAQMREIDKRHEERKGRW